MAQNKDTTDYEKLLYGAQDAEDPLLEMMCAFFFPIF